MRVAAVQHDIVWADRDANFAALSPLIREAAANGARLVVLSEMFSTGFVVDRDDIGEPAGGPSSAFLSSMATELGIWVCGSCPEVADGDPRPYNSFVVAAPDGTQHRYSKIHPFTYGGEDRHFRAGDSHVTIDVEGIRTSLFVCYDLRFADEFWALAQRTDLYLVPANWPVSRREHWMSLLRARAIENQSWVVGVNRVGSGGKLDYVGDSRIIDPLGNETVAGDGQCIVYADVTAESVAQTRERFPFLQDRR
ncbi:MAG: carbon-nitrogen family hydrolase [Actinobacteria bacterium]|nr:carbon-nitrogen family hydrolase [Actinomycetota bacterium]